MRHKLLQYTNDLQRVVENFGVNQGAPLAPIFLSTFFKAKTRVTPQSLPALQRVGARHCLRCGKPADAYCAQCGVAPYCGQRCQEIDWVQRHRNVCHNLARTSQGTAEVSKEVKPVEQVGMPDFPAPAPLRRPRSPAPSNKRDFKDDNNDRAKKTFTPPAQTNKSSANLNVRDGGNSRGGNSRGGKSRGGGQPRGGTNQADRRPRQNDSNVDEEDDTWDLKDNTLSRAPEAVTAASAQKLFVPKPKPDPVPQKSYQPTKKEPEVPKVETVQQRLYQPAKKEPEVSKVETVAQRYQPEKKEPEVPKVEPVAEVSYKPPVSVADTAPKMKTVPVKYLIETLSIGDVCVLTIDAQASECRSKSSGYVCLSLHEAKQLDFALLCEEDFTNDCEAAADYKPNPGDLFSYRNPEDGLFYRARRLDATSVALIDSSRVVTISAADVCKKIPAKYEDIVEFCCLLDAANVKVGDSVKITLKSKTFDGYNVQIDNSGTQSEGKVSRWVPLVEVPQPATKPVTGPVEVQVPRPEVRHKSTVLLVEAPAMDRVLVRPADTESVRRFDAVLQDVAQYGFHATPINEPPQKGQMVIGKFSDGLCYRALCIRTNVKANKFMLEYVEFGNVAISPRESIYACPQQWDLSAAPTVVSVVKLGAQYALTGDAAMEYIESVREAEFLLTLPYGAASAPSGAEVHLALSKNGESVNQKLLMMCKPDWKKIEESGGDVLDVRPIMLSDLEYVSLPAGGCEVEVLDVSMLASGALSGCERAPGRSVCDAIEPVSKQMEAYCNSELGQQPYLPSFEELCIAKCGPNQQWYRAALCEQVGGPGGAAARVLLVDYGNLETVPVSALRKMLPEFVRGVPALAPQLEIQGWPTTHTKDMLQRALKHMRITKEGRGVLKVTRCQQRMHGLYLVHAPELLEAMAAND